MNDEFEAFVSLDGVFQSENLQFIGNPDGQEPHHASIWNPSFGAEWCAVSDGRIASTGGFLGILQILLNK